MVIAVRTEQAGADLVVVKAARTDGDVARLTREAAMLRRCRHPGVVELLRVDDRSITLRHAGTALTRLGPLPLDESAGVVSAVADVVGAMHRLGVAHADLDADHVLIDQRGKPRVCGFGQATEVTLPGDPATDARSADVAALGRLLSDLLEAGGDLPWATPPTGLRKRAIRRQSRRQLDVLAQQATTADPAKRPTARQFAKALHAAVPELHLPTPEDVPAPTGFAELPDGLGPTDDIGWTSDDLSYLAHDLAHADDFDLSVPSPVPEPSVFGPERARIVLPDHEPDDDIDLSHVELPATSTHETSGRTATRLRAIGAALLFIVVLCSGAIAGAAGARAIKPFGGEDLEGSGTTTTTTTTTTTSIPTPTTAPPTWPDRCVRPETPGADVDGDGCPDAVTLEGRTATIRSISLTIGTDGDLVVLGDWDCDAIHTPAVLRPSSGEIFVFTEWHLTAPVEVGPSAVVDGASDLSARTSGGCSTLEVRTPTGWQPVQTVGT